MTVLPFLHNGQLQTQTSPLVHGSRGILSETCYICEQDLCQSCLERPFLPQGSSEFRETVTKTIIPI